MCYNRERRRRSTMYKILIVEDDMMIAKTLSSHLEKWDYEVRYVKDFKNVMNDFGV